MLTLARSLARSSPSTAPRQVLTLRKLGDVVLVVRDEVLKAQFLALPLPVVLALLGSNELKVCASVHSLAPGGCVHAATACRESLRLLIRRARHRRALIPLDLHFLQADSEDSVVMAAVLWAQRNRPSDADCQRLAGANPACATCVGGGSLWL